MVEGAVDGHLGETATHLALHGLAFLHAHLLLEQVVLREEVAKMATVVMPLYEQS